METVKTIIKGLVEVHKKLNGEGRHACTSEFFKELRSLGKNKFVTYSNKSPKTGEWMFDLIWSNESKKDWRIFKELQLVCESEWDMDLDALLMDFQKLMIAKAKIKLFICQGCKKNECKSNKELFNMLSNKIEEAFRSMDETWVLFISDNADEPTYWVWNYIKNSKEPNILYKQYV